MVALSNDDKERAYYHLGYGAARFGNIETGFPGSIDAADLARMEEACNNITSEYMERQVKIRLDQCDATDEASDLLTTGGVRFSVKEQYIGDVNRTIVREELDDIRAWREEYQQQTDMLAKLLGVANYNNPSADRYRYERSGAEYIAAIPGPADTAVSSRRTEFTLLAGGLGNFYL